MVISEKQKCQAKYFLELHQRNSMFLLPNAWSVGSAYVFEKQGFEAVATTSAGVAYDLGYPDGEDISFLDLLSGVEKITKRIDIPLSVDFERGYGDTPEKVKENALKLIAAGAVGFNIEDGMPDGRLDNLDIQISKIKALTELKKELSLDFVINARTCAYWLNVTGDDSGNFDIAVERGNAFKKAGADCVFIPGLLDEQTIVNLIKNIDAPINIILNPKFNDLNKLQEVGVKRLSSGSGPVRLIYDNLINIATDFKNGEVSSILNNSFTYDKANKYFNK